MPFRAAVLICLAAVLAAPAAASEPMTPAIRLAGFEIGNHHTGPLDAAPGDTPPRIRDWLDPIPRAKFEPMVERRLGWWLKLAPCAGFELGNG